MTTLKLMHRLVFSFEEVLEGRGQFTYLIGIWFIKETGVNLLFASVNFVPISILCWSCTSWRNNFHTLIFMMSKNMHQSLDSTLKLDSRWNVYIKRRLKIYFESWSKNIPKKIFMSNGHVEDDEAKAFYHSLGVSHYPFNLKWLLFNCGK